MSVYAGSAAGNAYLDIRVGRLDNGNYAVEMRYGPESIGSGALAALSVPQSALDGLGALTLDDAAHGRLLSESLLAQDEFWTVPVWSDDAVRHERLSLR